MGVEDFADHHSPAADQSTCDHAWSTRADGKIRFCIKCGKDGSSREWRQEEIEKLIGDFMREWMPQTPDLLQQTMSRVTVLERRVEDLMKGKKR